VVEASLERVQKRKQMIIMMAKRLKLASAIKICAITWKNRRRMELKRELRIPISSSLLSLEPYSSTKDDELEADQDSRIGHTNWTHELDTRIGHTNWTAKTGTRKQLLISYFRVWGALEDNNNNNNNYNNDHNNNNNNNNNNRDNEGEEDNVGNVGEVDDGE